MCAHHIRRQKSDCQKTEIIFQSFRKIKIPTSIFLSSDLCTVDLLHEFKTYPRLSALGTAIVELSRPIIHDIERIIEEIRSEKYHQKGRDKMNEPKKDRLKEITDGLEQGIKDLFSSEKYADYLRTMSNFHNYSLNNILLIHSQKPNATRVAGFSRWKDKFNRYVKKGEKGIKIIAPVIYKKRVEEVKRDPDTNLPLLDKDGKVIIEEKEVQSASFKIVSVYDISQTDGEPLPQLASSLKGDVRHYDEFVEALKRSSPVPVEFEKMQESMDGYFSNSEQRIAIREGMSEVQTVSALVHEIAHSILHNQSDKGEKYQAVEVFGQPAVYVEERIDSDKLPEGLFCYDLRGSDEDPGLPEALEETVTVNRVASVITAQKIELPETGYLPLNDSLNFTGDEKSIREFYLEQFPEKAVISRATEEVQAESISFAVCQYYGIETAENSFGYIATWSEGKDLKELKSSLETISKTSSGLITDIDKHFRDICKERGIDLSKESEQELPETTDVKADKTAEPVAQENEQTADEPAEDKEEQTAEPIEQEAFSKDMPDPTLTVKDMNDSGYLKEDMLPLSKEKAVELMSQDITVYALHSDNTEEMLFDVSEIEDSDSAMFGITKEDWEEIKDTVRPRDYEKEFLSEDKDSFLIYQLKGDAPMGLLFANLSETGTPNKENYEAVYGGAVQPDKPKNIILEDLFAEFNVNPPKDFKGHSMSVSDIVALKKDGEMSFHFVDSVGFKELPDFGKDTSEITPKPPTVAELREQAMSGNPISLMDLAEAAHRERKPKSILAQLKQPTVKKDKPKAPKKGAEMEI